MLELRRHFRPEFLNRVDETVMFTPLQLDQIKGIVALLMAQLQKRLDERKISVVLSEEAQDFIAEAAYDPTYGARPLRRYLQQHLETPLARKLVSGELLDGAQVRVDVADGDLVFTRK